MSYLGMTPPASSETLLVRQFGMGAKGLALADARQRSPHYMVRVCAVLIGFWVFMDDSGYC